MSHGVAGSILSHNLSCVGSRFTRAAEVTFASARPRDDVTLAVRDRDNGIIKRRCNIRDAGGDVFRPLGLADLYRGQLLLKEILSRDGLGYATD